MFGFDMKAPSVDDVAEWAEHFGLEGDGHRVLVGHRELLGPKTIQTVPGLMLVDRDGKLRFDAAGPGSPDDLWTDLLPALAPILDE